MNAFLDEVDAKIRASVKAISPMKVASPNPPPPTIPPRALVMLQFMKDRFIMNKKWDNAVSANHIPNSLLHFHGLIGKDLSGFFNLVIGPIASVKNSKV